MDSLDIDIFKDKSGEWRYRIKGANGEIMVTSEGYTTEEHAQRGFYELWRRLNTFVVSTVNANFKVLDA